MKSANNINQVYNPHVKKYLQHISLEESIDNILSGIDNSDIDGDKEKIRGDVMNLAYLAVTSKDHQPMYLQINPLYKSLNQYEILKPSIEYICNRLFGSIHSYKLTAPGLEDIFMGGDFDIGPKDVADVTKSVQENASKILCKVALGCGVKLSSTQEPNAVCTTKSASSLKELHLEKSAHSCNV